MAYKVEDCLRWDVQGLEDYFIVASYQEGSPTGRSDIVRKFDREEDRDAFEFQLERSRCELVAGLEQITPSTIIWGMKMGSI